MKRAQPLPAHRVRACAVAFALGFSSVSYEVSAQSRPFTSGSADDGVYGRLSSDSVLSAEVGGGIAFASGTVAPALSASLRFRALDTGGVFVFYQNAIGTSAGAARNDALGLGLDLRPLTLARIFQDWERGPRALDLFLDSIGLELGASVVNIGANWGTQSGLAWVLGTGFEYPLWWGSSTALTLRLSARWIHAHPSDAWVASLAPSDTVSVTGLLVLRTMVNLGHVGR